MKQGVTEEQWSNELTEPERLRIIEWTASKGPHAVTVRSIGHLIWFLDEHIAAYGGWWKIERNGEHTGWRVQQKYADFDNGDAPELIDALWNAVKVVLREGDNP